MFVGGKLAFHLYPLSNQELVGCAEFLAQMESRFVSQNGGGL